VLADDGPRTRTAEGWPAGKHLLTHTAQAVHIAAPIEVAFRRSLLGTHVRWCAYSYTDGGEGSGPGPFAAWLSRYAEVREVRVIVGEEDVLRFQVAVHHTAGMRIVERVSDLANDTDGVVELQRTFAVQTRAERLALHERHDEVQHAVGLPRVEQREDVGVLKPRDKPDLTQEAGGTERLGDLRKQHLDGNLTLVP